MADLESIVARLSELTVIEAAELSRMLEEKWGVSAARAPVIVGTPAQVAEPEPEQTEFDVVLQSYDPTKRINVLREVRAVTSLGLKESSDFLTTLPRTVNKDPLPRDAAIALRNKLEAAGCVVEMK